MSGATSVRRFRSPTFRLVGGSGRRVEALVQKRACEDNHSSVFAYGFCCQSAHRRDLHPLVAACIENHKYTKCLSPDVPEYEDLANHS